jgi:hypothetical protein
VFGYSGYRIFEESLRIDSSVYIFGLRLNMYIACLLTVVGAVWFYRSQRRPERALAASAPPPANALADDLPEDAPQPSPGAGQAAPGTPAT